MEYKEIALGIGIIIGAIAMPFVKIIFELIKGKKDNDNDTSDNYVTQKDLSDYSDKIYDDMDDRIEKATKDLATKESVLHLSEGFEKLEKKFESKMDEFSKTLTDAIVNIAVLAERRSKSRD